MLHFDGSALLPLIREAGEAILKVYKKESAFTLKEDRSPLTEADRWSNRILTDGLKRIAPEIPVLSEEGEQVPHSVRGQWQYYFLIDPLDGTKGFIRKDDEFAVNIALIHRDRPVIGLIHAPVSGITYVAESGAGAFLEESTGRRKLPLPQKERANVLAVLSRDESTSDLEELFARIGNVQIHPTGSSLKFGLIAAGTVDFYPRKRGSMEWDTAPGAVLVEEAGGQMLESAGTPLRYNRPNLLNPPFFAFNSFFMNKVPDWEQLLFSHSIQTEG